MVLQTWAVRGAFLSAGLYVANKVVRSLCAEPAKKQSANTIPPSMLDKLKETFLGYQGKLEKRIDPRTYFFICDVIADNAWITTLVIACLSKGKPLTGDYGQALEVLVGSTALCTLSWTGRFGISELSPKLGQYVGPSRERKDPLGSSDSSND